MTKRPNAGFSTTGSVVARWRITAVFVLWLLIFGLLGARLFDLQVLRAHRLARLAIRQQLESLHLPGRRGFILDRAGAPLAVNVVAGSIYAIPRAIPDPKLFAATVAPALRLTPAEVTARLRRGGPYFAWLARRQPRDVVEALRALRLGEVVGVAPEPRRAYPGGSLAASTIGFVGLDDAGLAGLELQYDGALHGVAGLGTARRDAIGRELVQTERIVAPPRDGDTLQLTIDQVVQHIAERELARAVDRANAQGGAVLVMDPQTGALLAIATAPTFDPNHYGAAPVARWKNRAVTEVYEPGSTFKLILAAAALSSRAVDPSEVFSDPGTIRINGATIHDAEPPEHTALTLPEIVKYSSNVGAAQVATRVGKQRLLTYIRQFGFGRITGIDLPGEVAGIVRPVGKWFGPSLQNIGFGQGISVTPIQLLVAVSAFATHGMAAHPHLVEAVRDSAGHVVATPGNIPPHRVIEPEVADRVLGMMRAVVEGGTGTKARLDGYPVAGKTGTAQRPGSAGGYEPGAYVSSFVGIVPAADPRLTVLVIVDRPRGVYFGGDVAAPAFREIARQVLWYLRVPPTQASE